MKTLVIGGGAIGLAFAHHLALGGAEVSLLVRPRQADLAEGATLYLLNARSRDVPVTFTPAAVFTDQPTALEQDWDLIILAVSSVALKGSWVAELGAATTCTVLAFANGPVAQGLVEPHFAKGQLVWGMLNVISYQTPLPHETRPAPGIAVYFPPGGLGFSGPPTRRDAIIKALKAGGFPAKSIPDVNLEVTFAGPILARAMTVLELTGWTFAGLSAHPERLDQAVAAMKESWALAEQQTGQPRPRLARWVSPFLLRRVLGLAPWILPFDLEAFFAYHYRKVAEQSLMNLRASTTAIEQAGLPATVSRALLTDLEALRAA